MFHVFWSIFDICLTSGTGRRFLVSDALDPIVNSTSVDKPSYPNLSYPEALICPMGPCEPKDFR